MNNPTNHECSSCGHTWLHGQHGGHDCKGRLKAMLESLKDPETVLVNMMRGAIATPTVRGFSKLFGEVVNGEDAQLLEIARLRAELAAIKAQEPDCDRSACGDFSPGPCDNPDCSARRDRMCAAPVVSAEQQGVADGWIPVSERLPIVADGKAIEVIVAVKRKHNGQVYVFTTEYLNCVQVNQDGQFVQDDDNDNAAITGWFYLSDDEETWHRTLGDGDELLAWQYKPAYAAAPAPSTTEGQCDE